MSDLYGIGSEISMGNMADQNVLERNREIEALNISNKKEYGDKIKSITAGFNQKVNLDKGEFNTEKKEEEATGVSGALKTGKDAVKFVQKKRAVLQRANDMLEGREPQTLRALPPDETNVIEEDFGRSLGMEGQSVVPARIGTAGNPVLASEVGDAVSDIGKSTGALSKGIDLVGKAGAGLGVATGILDAGKDVMSAIEGKGVIAGDNNLEKASNISGMISGGLEATGLALDTTGALAPLGLALNVAGGVAGAVSGALDFFGEKKDEKKQAQAKATAISKVPKPQQIQQEAVDTSMAQVPTQTSGRQNVVRSY
tara:strand:- start:2745 stop:3683 length:939 start_codon:yes stop_codon:yes gene_type:complete